MFGDEHGELLGLTVERLIPADLQAAHRRHRATEAEALRTRPMADRLVGLRKDGTMFPVEISFSPVTTTAGHFAFAVIRDVAAARQLEDLIDLTRSAVAACILEAGRRAPSSGNWQPWNFVVVTDREQLIELPKVWDRGRRHIASRRHHSLWWPRSRRTSGTATG